MRALCAGVFVPLGAFVVLISTAIAKYPGGTWFEPKAPAHHFFYNFLCDLLRVEGLNGKPNPTGSKLATAGMLALVVALAFYWIVMPKLMPGRPVLGQWVLWTGELSAAGVIAVALLPSDRFGNLHTVAIFLAVGPGMVAVTGGVFGAIFEPGVAPWQFALGFAVFACFVATAGLFVLHLFFGGGYLRILPLMQRMATLVSLVWVSVTTWQVFVRTGGQ